MADIIEMPKLSDTMTVGTLVKWLKKEGDKVASGDMLAEVETDKATMELECFFDGVIVKIFIPAGSQVPIGAALCAIGKPGEKVDAPAGAAPAGSPAPVPAGGRLRISPLARKLAAAKNIDPAGIAGSGPGGRIVRADV